MGLSHAKYYGLTRQSHACFKHVWSEKNIERNALCWESDSLLSWDLCDLLSKEGRGQDGDFCTR